MKIKICGLNPTRHIIEIQEEIQNAFEHAISSSNPQERDLYTHVYSQ